MAVGNKGDSSPIILSNLEFFPGRRVHRHLGLVQGSSVRAKNVGRDIMASLKNIVGGELKGYTELMRESRDQAIMRMVEEARSIGANAVMNIRLGTSSITAGAAEVMAYGTAVILGDDEVVADVGVEMTDTEPGTPLPGSNW